MRSMDDAAYRLRLAEGFFVEAREDLGLQRWRSCADNSQLTVENSAKAVLALLGPVGRTHDPGPLLRRAIASNRFANAFRSPVERLATVAEILGWDVHISTDYGDDVGRRTPWELFNEAAAGQALNPAEEALVLARELFGAHGSHP